VKGIYTLVTGARTFDGNGRMIGGRHAMASTILTGVGLPIEGETRDFPTNRFGGTYHHPIDSYILTPFTDLSADTQTGIIHGTAVHGIQLDPGIPTGWYQLRIDIGLEIAQSTLVSLWGEDSTSPAAKEDLQTYAVTSPVAIGTLSQPKMIWTLFSNNPESGPAVADEDRGLVALTRGTGFSDKTILPMTDPQGGQIRYLLEPDFPLIWNPFMRTKGTQIEFDYESGWMQARIENPDGSIVDLAGAKFAGHRGIGATTLQDRFAYSFSSYGLHRIELTGWIKDKSGQTYTGGGVYEINIARPLEIRTNILPGTPFKRNDFLDPGFQLFPPVPARVQVEWKLDRLSSGLTESGEFDAPADRWGYYSPPKVLGRNRVDLPSRIQFTNPGEYKVTFTATYTDPNGALWMGEKVLAGVVVSDDAIALASRPQGAGAYSITSDARYMPVPADSGDTMIIPEPSSPELPTVFTFPLGFFLEGQTGFRADDSALRVIPVGTAGTFVTPRLATSDGLFPHFYAETIDRRAYLFTSATRSDGLTEARVGDGSQYSQLPYPTFPWLAGELPADSSGDVYHFWSGMVYRDIAHNTTHYGFYSTGGVISSDTSVPRAHAPGSTIISDGWGAHSLFMHNLAVGPGSILAQDTPFTPAAYFLPLASTCTVEFTVIPPNGGTQITVTVPGDFSGYAASSRDRVNLDRPGVWQVVSKITQGSEVGGVLGVEQGQPWNFYVLDNDYSLPMKFGLPMESTVDPSQPIVLNGDLHEADIVSGNVSVTTTFNGAVVEQTQVPIAESVFQYTVDLSKIADSFTNYSPNDPRDRIVITLFAEGAASNGQHRMAARMLYIQGGTLNTGDIERMAIAPQAQ
jgi:hypothetical protein